MEDDPLSDILKKSSKVRRTIPRKPKEIEQQTSISNYEEAFFPEFSDKFDKGVQELLSKRGSIFKLFVAPPGSAKTSSVFRQAEELGWEVYKFDSTEDWTNDKIKNKMLNLVSVIHHIPMIILLDDIDYNKLPMWLYPKRKIIGYDKQQQAIYKKVYRRKTFLEKAQKNCKKGNFTVIATCNEEWKIDYEFKKFFEEIKTRGVYPSRLKKASRKHYNIELPEEFPRDIRQFHQFIATGGLNKSYIRIDSSFTEVYDFLKEVPRGDIPNVKPPIETWIMVNTLNSDSTGMVQKHTIKFYDIISLLCLADQYGCRKMLRSLPRMKFFNQRMIKHPNTYFKRLKEMRSS